MKLKAAIACLTVGALAIGTGARLAGRQVDGLGASPSGGATGVYSAALDQSVDACDNFYLRACGGFLASRPSGDLDAGVNMLAQYFDKNLETGMTRLFSLRSPDPELKRLKTFYASCRSGSAGDAERVRSLLSDIERIRTQADLQGMIRELAMIGADPFFTFSGEPDPSNWNRYRGEIHGARLWAERGAVAAAFQDAGQAKADAERDADVVVAMVTELKEQQGDRYDPKTSNNPRSLGELRRLAPSIDWSRYFTMIGASPQRPINVTSPAYLRAVQSQLATRTPAELRPFLRWTLLLSLRGELPAPYGNAFGEIIAPLRVRNADPAGRCRDAAVRAMGVEFSRQYSRRILGRSARDAALRLAKSIKTTIVASIAGDSWLSPKTRTATAAKLAATDLKIGFPDRWPAVGHFHLDEDGFLDNVLAARRFEQQRAWRRAGRSRLRTDWEMIVRPWVGEGMAAARLVIPNGFPDAFSNSLIMTAAFLAPPRFDASSAPEVNYGTFGTLFAHEFVHVAETHMFGSDGRPREMWSGADLRASDRQHQCVVEQAEEDGARSGLSVPGGRQLGENVADFGGVRLAYEALAARLGPAIQRIDRSGTSPAQRFFYRYAQNYCTAQSDKGRSEGALNDPHGTPAFRVNGPLSNLPAFGQAFGCRSGARMMRPAAKQCRVW